MYSPQLYVSMPTRRVAVGGGFFATAPTAVGRLDTLAMLSHRVGRVDIDNAVGVLVQGFSSVREHWRGVCEGQLRVLRLSMLLRLGHGGASSTRVICLTALRCEASSQEETNFLLPGRMRYGSCAKAPVARQWGNEGKVKRVAVTEIPRSC